MNPILFGSGKAQGSILLPASKVGAQKHLPLVLLAKDEKARESLFPIPVG